MSDSESGNENEGPMSQVERYKGNVEVPKLDKSDQLAQRTSMMKDKQTEVAKQTRREQGIIKHVLWSFDTVR